MVSRPTSIVVISWLLIILSILSAVGYLSIALQQNDPQVQEALKSSPLPAPVQFGMMVAGIAIQFACGYAMLGGKNWARVLYVAWNALGICIAFFTVPAKLFLLPGIAIFAVIVFFLYRPAANAFFAAGGANIEPQSAPSTARIASLVFYILAGFFFACTGPGALLASPAPIVKPIMLGFLAAPFFACLLIGRWLAPETWKWDAGVTIFISTLIAAFMCIVMVQMLSTPEFAKALPSEKIKEMKELLNDYLFASIWFGAWAILGTALTYLGWKTSSGGPEDKDLPPTIGH
jgi:hypothetical protein